MKVEYIETSREILEPGPEYVIIMVPFYIPQTEWDYKGYTDPMRGKRRQYLVQYKMRVKGKRYVDDEFTSDWVQYISE